MAHAFHFKENLSRTHHRDPMIRSAFAFPHTGFGRLLGHRLIGKKTQPDFSAALHKAGHGHAARLNLAVSNVAAFHNLEPVIPERKLGAAPGLTCHASALLLAVLNFFRHQHKSQFPVLSDQSSVRSSSSVTIEN